MTQEQEQLEAGILNQAEELIDRAAAQLRGDAPDHSQVEADLRQALELLEQRHDPQVQGALNRAGENWRILVENTPDVNRSENLLQEGAKLFSNLPVGESLESMLKLNRQIFSLKNALAVQHGRDWPEWFEKPNASKWFQSLIKNADELLEEPSWPTLQEQAGRYREMLLEQYLPDYTAQLSQEAHRQARQGDFARALQTIQNALQFFSAELDESIPESIDLADLTQLKRAIEARQRSEVALWTAIVHIVGETASFQEALSGIELEVPDHPDVAIGDLQTTLSDLKKAAKLEGAVGEFSEQGGYQMDFQELERRGQVHFESLEDPAGFLTRSDPQTAKKFQSLLLDLRDKATNAPDHVVRQLISRLEWSPNRMPQDAASLVKPYWQLVWFLQKDELEDPDLIETSREVLSAARSIPAQMLVGVVELFENVQSEQELNQFLRYLSSISLLDQGLASYPQPTETNQEYGDLPPLPAGIELPEDEPKLDGEALAMWEEVVYTWLKRSHEDVPSNDHSSGDGTSLDLESWEQSVLAYMREVEMLKGEVWPRLDLPPWGKNSLPDQLESGGEQYLLFVTVLRAIHGKLTSRSTVESARSWDQRMSASGLARQLEEPIIWLLEPQRLGMVEYALTLKTEIKAQLEIEIEQLLEQRPPSADQLHDQVLAAGLAGEFALLTQQTIKNHTTRLAGDARKRGDHQASLAIAEAVRQATQPWADHPSKPTDGTSDNGVLWRDLHRWATWEYRKAFLFTHPRQAIIGAVALVVVLVALGFGGNALLGRAGDNGRMAISAADAGTLTAVAAQSLTPTEDTQSLSTIEALIAGRTATQQAAEELAATEKVQAKATALVRLQNFLDQTATAQVVQATEDSQNATATAFADPAFQATALALRCQNDSSAYSLEIIDGPKLNPDLRTVYVMGNSVFSATASWTIRNVGECDWTSLSPEPYLDALDVSYFLLKDSQEVELTADNPLEVGQSLTIYLGFRLLEARDIQDAWNLVANGVEIDDAPHLELSVDDWIIVVNPSPTPTSKPGGRRSGGPNPTARPSKPPPTARP